MAIKKPKPKAKKVLIVNVRRLKKGDVIESGEYFMGLNPQELKRIKDDILVRCPSKARFKSDWATVNPYVTNYPGYALSVEELENNEFGEIAL